MILLITFCTLISFASAQINIALFISETTDYGDTLGTLEIASLAFDELDIPDQVTLQAYLISEVRQIVPVINEKTF
jgi:hypothetical protein